MLLFPPTPNVGDTFTGPNGQMWVWDGIKWSNVVSSSVPLVRDAPQDGITYLRKNGAWIPMTTASAVLAANVTVPVASFVDGPSVNLGNVGTWFVSATASFYHATAACSVVARVWDGITIIGDAATTIANGTQAQTISISGIITNPAGAVKVSASSPAVANGLMGSNFFSAQIPSTTRQTQITAIRIG